MNQGIGGQISVGTTVYDAVGDKIGTVREVNAQGGYLDVEKGWLFPKDVYIPLSMVQRSDADGVYLSIYKDDLAGQDWDTPPVGGASTIARGVTRGEVDDEAEVRVPLVEEELVAGKRQEEVGRVHLHKDVVEEQQTVNVPLQQERVTVERVPVSGDADAAVRDAFTERDIDVPVMGEQAVVEKRAQVTEEVHLRKDTVTEQQQVSDTVRKERLTVEGADEVRGADSRTDLSRDQ